MLILKRFTIIEFQYFVYSEKLINMKLSPTFRPKVFILFAIFMLSFSSVLLFAQSNNIKTYYLKELKVIYKYEKTKEFAFEVVMYKNVTIEFNEVDKLITITGTDPNDLPNQKIHLHFVEYFLSPLTGKPNGEMIMMDNYNNKSFVRFDPTGDRSIFIFNNPEKIVNGMTYFSVGKEITTYKSW